MTSPGKTGDLRGGARTQVLRHEWEVKRINAVILAEQVPRSLGQRVILVRREEKDGFARAQFHWHGNCRLHRYQVENEPLQTRLIRGRLRDSSRRCAGPLASAFLRSDDRGDLLGDVSYGADRMDKSSNSMVIPNWRSAASKMTGRRLERMESSLLRSISGWISSRLNPWHP